MAEQQFMDCAELHPYMGNELNPCCPFSLEKILEELFPDTVNYGNNALEVSFEEKTLELADYEVFDADLGPLPVFEQADYQPVPSEDEASLSIAPVNCLQSPVSGASAIVLQADDGESLLQQFEQMTESGVGDSSPIDATKSTSVSSSPVTESSVGDSSPKDATKSTSVSSSPVTESGVGDSSPIDATKSTSVSSSPVTESGVGDSSPKDATKSTSVSSSPASTPPPKKLGDVLRRIKENKRETRRTTEYLSTPEDRKRGHPKTACPSRRQKIPKTFAKPERKSVAGAEVARVQNPMVSVSQSTAKPCPARPIVTEPTRIEISCKDMLPQGDRYSMHRESLLDHDYGKKCPRRVAVDWLDCTEQYDDEPVSSSQVRGEMHGVVSSGSTAVMPAGSRTVSLTSSPLVNPTSSPLVNPTSSTPVSRTSSPSASRTSITRVTVVGNELNPCCPFSLEKILEELFPDTANYGNNALEVSFEEKTLELADYEVFDADLGPLPVFEQADYQPVPSEDEASLNIAPVNCLQSPVSGASAIVLQADDGESLLQQFEQMTESGVGDSSPIDATKSTSVSSSPVTESGVGDSSPIDATKSTSVSSSPAIVTESSVGDSSPKDATKSTSVSSSPVTESGVGDSSPIDATKSTSVSSSPVTESGVGDSSPKDATKSTSVSSSPASTPPPKKLGDVLRRIKENKRETRRTTEYLSTPEDRKRGHPKTACPSRRQKIPKTFAKPERKSVAGAEVARVQNPMVSVSQSTAKPCPARPIVTEPTRIEISCKDMLPQGDRYSMHRESLLDHDYGKKCPRQVAVDWSDCTEQYDDEPVSSSQVRGEMHGVVSSGSTAVMPAGSRTVSLTSSPLVNPTSSPLVNPTSSTPVSRTSSPSASRTSITRVSQTSSAPASRTSSPCVRQTSSPCERRTSSTCVSPASSTAVSPTSGGASSQAVRTHRSLILDKAQSNIVSERWSLNCISRGRRGEKKPLTLATSSGVVNSISVVNQASRGTVSPGQQHTAPATATPIGPVTVTANHIGSATVTANHISPATANHPQGLAVDHSVMNPAVNGVLQPLSSHSNTISGSGPTAFQPVNRHDALYLMCQASLLEVLENEEKKPLTRAASSGVVNPIIVVNQASRGTVSPGQQHTAPVTATPIGPVTVTANHIGSATANHIGPVTATANHIGPATANHIGPATANHIGPATATGNHIDPVTATATPIGPVTVTANHIGSATVTANHIGPVTATANHIGPATANHIGPATANHIGPATATGNHIDPVTATATPIGPVTVTANHIGPPTANHLQGLAVDHSVMNPAINGVLQPLSSHSNTINGSGLTAFQPVNANHGSLLPKQKTEMKAELIETLENIRSMVDNLSEGSCTAQARKDDSVKTSSPPVSFSPASASCSSQTGEMRPAQIHAHSFSVHRHAHKKLPQKENRDLRHSPEHVDQGNSGKWNSPFKEDRWCQMQDDEYFRLTRDSVVNTPARMECRTRQSISVARNSSQESPTEHTNLSSARSKLTGKSVNGSSQEAESGGFSKLPSYIASSNPSIPRDSGRKELRADDIQLGLVHDSLPLDCPPAPGIEASAGFSKIPSYATNPINSTIICMTGNSLIPGASKTQGSLLESRSRSSAERRSRSRSPVGSRSGSYRSKDRSHASSSRRHSRHSDDDDTNSYRKGRRRENRNHAKIENMKQRKTMYVGGIPDSFTHRDLRRIFGKYGPIEHAAVHFPEDRYRDNYGFVTFSKLEDTNSAIELGNKDPNMRYQLCYGGRRLFCQNKYADLDANNAIQEEYNTGPREKEESFEKLLKRSLQQLPKKNGSVK